MQTAIESKVLLIEEKHGKEVVDGFSGYGNDIQYHIKNENNEVVFRNWTPFEGENDYSRFLVGSGSETGKIGHTLSNDSLIPSKGDEQLTFVLDGVLKTIPADLSIKVNRKELKKRPIPFEYEGDFGKSQKSRNKQIIFYKNRYFQLEREHLFKLKRKGKKRDLHLSLELGF